MREKLVKFDYTVLGFGVLCLVGGILLAYFGYFAPPYLLLTMGFPVDITVLFAPLLLIFLGGLIVVASFIGKTPRRKKKKAEPLSPPPPP